MEAFRSVFTESKVIHLILSRLLFDVEPQVWAWESLERKNVK